MICVLTEFAVDGVACLVGGQARALLKNFGRNVAPGATAP